MVEIVKARMSAEIEGDFVVFLIGVRINRAWKIWKWLPVFVAMPRMLRELAKAPEIGLLHARTHFGMRNTMVVQYWRSFEHLRAYSRAPFNAHLPAWKSFNQAIASNGDVGIWHETYLVRAGEYENIYNNMPAFGAGLAGTLREASGKRGSASGRLNRAED